MDIPSIGLLDHAGSAVELPGVWDTWTLLYWFPKADTPGCTAQAEGLRDQAEAFAELDCRVFGASFDSPSDLRLFRDRYRLGFALLSDQDRVAGRAFGVAGPQGDSAHPSRTAFLWDGDGRVVRVYAVDDPGHFAELVLGDLEVLTE